MVEVGPGRRTVATGYTQQARLACSPPKGCPVLILLDALLARLNALAARLAAPERGLLPGVRPGSPATALLVAAGSMLLFGLGGWLWWWTSGLGDIATVFAKTVLFGAFASFGLWLGWLIIVYAILERLTGRTVRVELLLREAGYATAPLGLGVLMVLPGLAFGIGLFAIGVWVLAMQTAVERATGERGSVVLMANAAGFALWALVLTLLSTGSHPLAPGPFVAESVWEAVVRLAPGAVR